MSYMVVDLTESTGNPPFGKFGPFPDRAAAETFRLAMARPDSYFSLPSEQCR